MWHLGLLLGPSIRKIPKGLGSKVKLSPKEDFEGILVF